MTPLGHAESNFAVARDRLCWRSKASGRRGMAEYDSEYFQRQFEGLPPEAVAIIALRASMRVLPVLACRRSVDAGPFAYWGERAQHALALFRCYEVSHFVNGLTKSDRAANAAAITAANAAANAAHAAANAAIAAAAIANAANAARAAFFANAAHATVGAAITNTILNDIERIK